MLSVYNKSMAWFSDPKNRAEAIKIMVDASKLKEDDVDSSYDFLHKNAFFESTGRVSRTKMGALLKALKRTSATSKARPMSNASCCRGSPS